MLNQYGLPIFLEFFKVNKYVKAIYWIYIIFANHNMLYMLCPHTVYHGDPIYISYLFIWSNVVGWVDVAGGSLAVAGGSLTVAGGSCA